MAEFSSELFYLPVTGLQLQETLSFLDSGRPDETALNRWLLPKGQNPSSLLTEYKYDVRVLLEKYNELKKVGVINTDSIPIPIGNLTEDITQVNSYIISNRWKDFNKKSDPNIITRQTITDLLSNWINFHRTRVGISTAPGKGRSSQIYVEKIGNYSISVQQAEKILYKLVDRFGSSNDVIFQREPYVNEFTKIESQAFDLISKFSNSPTAVERTPAMLKILALQGFRSLQRQRMLSASEKARKAAEIEKVATLEEKNRLMTDLRGQLREVQDEISKDRSDFREKSDNLKALEGLRDQIFSAMQNMSSN